MLKRAIAVAAIALSTVPALASDASFELRGAPAQTEAKTAGPEARPSPGACQCVSR